MSKKRRAKKNAQAVVTEEVLAEGSGPHAVPEEADVVAVQVSTEPLEDVDQPVTTESEEISVEAAAEVAPEGDRPVRKGKGRGKKAKAAEPTDEIVETSDAEQATDADAVEMQGDADASEQAASTEGEEFAATEVEAIATEGEHVAGDHAEAMQASSADENGEQLEEIEDGEALTEGEAAVLPTSAATMDAAQLKSLVEALVFASDKPLTVPRLRQLTRVAEVRRLEQALAELAADYEGRGLILHSVSGGYQFRTRPKYSIWVQQLIAGRPVRLSRAQLETLAIVAYRQPITRPEIDDIRGVDSSATLKLLLDRTLIRALGKKEEVGRPTLYGTTKEFLDFFSLGDLRELPTLREYSELSEESRKVMSDRLGIDPDGGGESGGSAPPSEGGPRDGGPMDGTPEGASMAAGTPTDDDDLGGATIQGMGVGSEAEASDEGDDLGGATVSSDGDGFGGETVQSMDGEGLDDATVGSGPIDEIDGTAEGSVPVDQIDDTPPADEVDAASASDADQMSADAVTTDEVDAAGASEDGAMSESDAMSTDDVVAADASMNTFDAMGTEAAFGDGDASELAEALIAAEARAMDDEVEAADASDAAEAAAEMLASDVIATDDVITSGAEPTE